MFVVALGCHVIYWSDICLCPRYARCGISPEQPLCVGGIVALTPLARRRVESHLLLEESFSFGILSGSVPLFCQNPVSSVICLFSTLVFCPMTFCPMTFFYSSRLHDDTYIFRLCFALASERVRSARDKAIFQRAHPFLPFRRDGTEGDSSAFCTRPCGCHRTRPSCHPQVQTGRQDDGFHLDGPPPPAGLLTACPACWEHADRPPPRRAQSALLTPSGLPSLSTSPQ